MSSKKKIPKNKLELNYEQAINRMHQIIQKLESEELTLDESLLLYQEGAELKNHCQKILDDAKMKIEIVKKI